MTRLYGLAKCSTCIKARAWLDEHGIDHQFIDYREQPIDPPQLAEWAARLTWPKLVNRASMTWRNLPEARKTPDSDAQWLALVAEFPALIRRPLTVYEGQVDTGFSEKKYSALFTHQ